MNLVVALNTFNLTTPAGWITASAAGCRIARRDQYWEATGFHWRFPIAGAFTVGCVVISRKRLPESVWEHEMSHMRQYALLGALFPPAYAAASGYSLLRTGDWWSRNIFERAAGLSAGGYRERPARAFTRSGRRRRGATDAGAAVA